MAVGDSWSPVQFYHGEAAHLRGEISWGFFLHISPEVSKTCLAVGPSPQGLIASCPSWLMLSLLEKNVTVGHSCPVVGVVSSLH